MDTPVILLTGPRQAGKTTLVRQIAEKNMLHYLTLDDEVTMLSAQKDPAGMIRSLDRAVIDEIQRAPKLLLAIKKNVDDDRRPGRFLLTGSANLMSLPTVADSLAGRMETFSLLPLSQSEMENQTANWIERAFTGEILSAKQPVFGDELVHRVLRGGYPEAVSRKTEKRRKTWAQQYITALLQRDVREIANIDKLDNLPRFLNTIAQTAGQMCNYSQLGGQLNLDSKTTSRYISIFEQMYLLKRVDVWSRNHLKRIIKTPKLQFIDAGLLGTLIDLSYKEIQKDRTRFGKALETFVFAELLKKVAESATSYQLMYYRDMDKFEVDIVIENSAGILVGVEVKASATVNEKDLRGLKKFASLAGDQFKMGVLLYDGIETMPLGDNIWAVPLSSLWGA